MRMYDFERARTFIYSQARLLERQLFAARYEGGSKAAVVSALQAYQNADGGFGNALEPDLRTPASQPLAVERAWVALDWIDAFDEALALRACDWLQTVTTPAGGVPFALASLEGYPHAPWMRPSPEASLNPTASLCALLLKHGVRHPWLTRATEYCWNALPGFESEQFHDIQPILDFLAHAPGDADRVERETARWIALAARPGVVTLDPQAVGYVKYPLDWAPNPGSPLRSLFSDALIETHLDALAARQQPDGGWPINWQALSPAAEAEWRGWVTLEALNTLQAYGR